MKDFFYKYANRDDLIAIRTSANNITYKELFNSTEELSAKLSAINDLTNRFVPIISSNNSEFIRITLALWNKGFVPVPINTRWTEIEIENVLTRHKFDLVFYQNIFLIR